MIEDQSNDKELLDLFKIALTPVEAEKVSVGYLIKDDILMRKWSPTACDNNEKGETVYQIVDVAKWCKECHTCQLGGKPNQNIPQAPLHPIPAFDEPFSHIIIDCCPKLSHKMSIC